MKKIKKPLLFALFVLFGASFAFAQGTVTGTVVDNTTGETLPFVAVQVKGTSTGTATSIDGVFTITVPSAESVLVFSFVGYETLELPANVQGMMMVRMKSLAATLGEVLITGFQTITRERATGAYSTVTANTLQERFTPNVLDNLEGRVAGLVSYGGRVMIRGTGTLFAESNPLLVVDGLPIEGSLEDLNPYDIESVTILKDAAASAIYGARASNGVIVVVTKRASAHNKIEIDVSSNLTIYQKRNVNYADNFFMSPAQQVDAENDYYRWFYNTSPQAGDNFNNTTRDLTTRIQGSYITPVQYAHWQLRTGVIDDAELQRRLAQYRTQNFAKDFADEALKNRVLQQYNVAVRNRTANFQSNLVLNLRTDNSGIIHANDNRLTIFYKGTYDMAKWLTANFSVNSILQRSTESNSRFTTNPFSRPAYYSLFNPDGSYARLIPATAQFNNYLTYAETDPYLNTMHFNHLEELALDQTKTDRQNMRYHGELLFKIVDGLTFNTQFLYETSRLSAQSYSESESFVMRWMKNMYTRTVDGTTSSMLPAVGGKLVSLNESDDHWTGRAQLNFNRILAKDHSVDAIAGLEFRETRSKGLRNLLFGWDDQLQSHGANQTSSYSELSEFTRTTYFNTNFNLNDQPEIFPTIFNPYIMDATRPVAESWNRNASGYANLTYTYKSRYNAFASLRKDFANVYGLASEFRGAPFWSVGGSWNMEYEDFMSKFSWVNALKPRITYGQTGNIYQGATSYMTATNGERNQYTGLPFSTIESPGNPTLSWEIASTFNTGVEFMLFDHRLRGVLDWYSKKTDKVFSALSVDHTKGFSSLAMNLANVKNSGVELTLAYDWIRPQSREGFGWTTSGTASWNNNEVTYVEVQATRAFEQINLGYRKGDPIGSLYSYEFAGLNSRGSQEWLTADGRRVGVPIISEGIESVKFSGQIDPKHTFAMENRWTWNGLSLNVMMVYYGGHHMRAQQYHPLSRLTHAGPLASYYLNAWTPENTNTNVPGIGQHHDNTAPINEGAINNTDIFVYQADFFKIRNIVLGYDLPRTITSKFGVNSLSLRFQVDNPALWTKNSLGIDPETLGIRNPVCYIFGLNIRF